MRKLFIQYLEKYPIKVRIILLALFIGLLAIGANTEGHSAKLACFLPAVLMGVLLQLDNDAIRFLFRVK